ncbi:ADM_HP2_G0045670.mRNA.1.CDS.1 [Saccharomyces cerevisiae]|nr:ADM_HP2_G0045670.mRNA.1.CDS.1 [Saccharomyces cerevisiae]CAI6765519.1 ADM_HP2_G0045670.mRNA.1.CDS.1 [Saccharomyces cerevisiae]CAI6777608.1 ADM_HP1_G0047730.mRNA.1.CDS.1 [Saccharomyces cerevisiae]
MGQSSSISSSNEEGSSHSKKFTNSKDILAYFNNKAQQQVTIPELVSFKGNLQIEDLNTPISHKALCNSLYFPQNHAMIVGIVTNMLRVLSNFPLMKSSYEPITGYGLLKCILLLNRARCAKFLKTKSYDQLKLLFISLSLQKTDKEELSEESENDGNKELTIKQIITGFDDVDTEMLCIPADFMLQFLTWLLILTVDCPTTNSKLDNTETHDQWGNFKVSALNLLRTMNPDVVGDIESHSITFQQFSTAIRTVMPNLLKPLENLMEHFFYLQHDLVDHDTNLSSIQDSKVMTPALLAQLSTGLPKELFIHKLQSLYIGRKSGFSMRSLQAKVFKWMAPSILVVSGMRITNSEEYAAEKNPRYRHFLEEFPKLKESDQMMDASHLNKRKTTFAVYIDDPWKVTNKDYFGDLNTRIIEISPRQDIYKVNQKGTIYFNTIGGGIGIGDKQPLIKPASKRYIPGNVSLTFDSTLEFAVFRNTGYGGSLDPGLLSMERKEENSSYELHFLIQDVEVWGCGGEKELEEQIKQLEWEEAESKRRQQINLRSLGEDRALLEMAGLVGQHQGGGSM